MFSKYFEDIVYKQLDIKNLINLYNVSNIDIFDDIMEQKNNNNIYINYMYFNKSNIKNLLKDMIISKFGDFCNINSISKNIKDLILTQKIHEIQFSKNDFWNKVPFLIPSLYDNIYYHFKLHCKNDKTSLYCDFDKYYKMRGLKNNEKWKTACEELDIPNKKKFLYKNIKNLKFIIDDNLFKQFELHFFKLPKYTYFWPFMTSIVSDGEVRDDKYYPLITPKDILKIDFLSKFIIDKKHKQQFFNNMMQYFNCKEKQDIIKWKNNITNKRYIKLLDRAYRKKVKYKH
jgi:hypothetical protein